MGCILIGILPQIALRAAAAVTTQLLGSTISFASPWGWIAPIAPRQASYSGLLLLAGTICVIGLTYLLVRLLAHGRMRRTVPWDCGYPWQTSRMQDTAEGFGHPIRHIFRPVFDMERELPSPADKAPRYRIHVDDRLARIVYQPIARAVQRVSDAIGVVQSGRLAIYLLFSFLTLLGLLAAVL